MSHELVAQPASWRRFCSSAGEAAPPRQALREQGMDGPVLFQRTLRGMQLMRKTGRTVFSSVLEEEKPVGSEFKQEVAWHRGVCDAGAWWSAESGSQ